MNTRRQRDQVARPLLAEFTGSAMLVAIVVGSGIAAERLSPDDVGLQLLENSTATALGLAVLILARPGIWSALQPVVSLTDWLLGRRSGAGINGRTLLYGIVQVLAPSPVRSWPTQCSTYP
jgi:glycerol uptake facilitator-like aquaporin